MRQVCSVFVLRGRDNSDFTLCCRCTCSAYHAAAQCTHEYLTRLLQGDSTMYLEPLRLLTRKDASVTRLTGASTLPGHPPQSRNEERGDCYTSREKLCAIATARYENKKGENAREEADVASLIVSPPGRQLLGRPNSFRGVSVGIVIGVLTLIYSFSVFPALLQEHRRGSCGRRMEHHAGSQGRDDLMGQFFLTFSTQNPAGTAAVEQSW